MKNELKAIKNLPVRVGEETAGIAGIEKCVRAVISFTLATF